MIRSQSSCFLGIITIYFFFCLLPLPNTTFASPARFLCRRDQRDALLEFKKEFPITTDEDKSGTTTSWNKSVDCCSWEGVNCDANLGEVISLDLYRYYNAPYISLKPSSGLFKLQHLTYLYLSSWNLQGEIPSSIGNLSHLTYLDLSDNNLVGEVPASVGNLNQLGYMNLSGNGLRGNIPSSFSNLTKLSVLKLDGNQFTGGVRVIANLTNLSEIDLSNNHFTSLITADLSGLHNLERFLGKNNSFFGPFPSSLFMIPSLVYIALGQNQFEEPIDFRNTSSSSNLQVLHVGYNNFNGLFPKYISKLHNLIDLDLSGNNFSGLIPCSIGTLRNLNDLDLSENNFRGRVPSCIGELRTLQCLDLNHNNFVGRLPRSISKLVNLKSLDLSYNKFEGPVEIPHCISYERGNKIYSRRYYADLSHNSFSSIGKSVGLFNGSLLRELDLSSNSLQGPIPQRLCNFEEIFFLDLSNNHFNGSIPQCLENCTGLNKLNLRNNSLTGSLPDFCIHYGSPLNSLDVSHNNLVGKLPKALINCNNIQFLNVRGNKIKDTFPFWLDSLLQLKILVLSSNAFYGPVYNPSAYLGFPSLSIIDISNNNFVGSLPHNYFANWTEMSLVWDHQDHSLEDYYGSITEYLGLGFNIHNESIDLVYKGVNTDFGRIFKGFKAIDFSGNRFSGHIPRSIGLLSELRLLNLSGNSFTGNIPPSLANITKLEALDLSRNNLSGNIPQGLGKLSFLSIINFSHNHLQGLLPQSTQFGSQKCSSFVGNPGLYGLEKICKDLHASVPTTSQQPDESSSEPKEPVVNWIAAVIAFGPGVFCGLVIRHIFTSYKHEWFIAR